MKDEDHDYRAAWLDCFLATYAMVGVLAGIAVAVATSIKKESNAPLVGAICVLSAIQVVLILWMFRRLRVVYDRIGFTPQIADEARQAAFHAESMRYAERGKTIRKASEIIIHVILLAQGVLLWIAWS